MATDWEVVQTMERFGEDSFVRAVAKCCHRVGHEDIAKVKAVWPETWAEYARMTEALKTLREGA